MDVQYNIDFVTKLLHVVEFCCAVTQCRKMPFLDPGDWIQKQAITRE